MKNYRRIFPSGASTRTRYGIDDGLPSSAYLRYDDLRLENVQDIQN